MSHAIRIHATGGPEQMIWEEVPVGDPGAGEVRVRHTAVGLNFIDVYHRSGLYPLPSLPHVLGMEGCGVVEALGDGVSEFEVGDRVAYAGVPPGAYAEVRLIPWHRLVRVPDGIADTTAAAMMLQGMTAQYLLRRTYRVQAGDTILIHAAAGGVGLIACQWAKHLGATVIGTVGSAAKAQLAREHGCDHTILYREEDFVARVNEITGGAKCAVVYDSVGRDTFVRSLDCLRMYGMGVLFGQASGLPDPLDLNILAPKGSLFVTRPTLMVYTAKRDELVQTASELFDVVLSGAVRIEVNQTYPLREAARAHRDLEARKTTGSTVLLP
jgi:NADPH2:quinone reductase